MKRISFIILFNVISISLFAQIQKFPTYSEAEILLKTSTGNISGSLTVPNSAKISPLVLIIPGSGPTDRDCNSPQLGLQTNTYKILSQEFIKKGISTLRYDKRGIGGSKSALKDESDLKFETYINDVISWVSFVKADKRFSRIILLGHSEGSLVGMVAAQKANVSAYVSVAGAAKSADKILREQFNDKLSPFALSEFSNIIDSLKMGKKVMNVFPDFRTLFRPGVQPYMISWMKYDPVKEISKVKVPVLIVHGTTDLQIKTEQAKLLQASRPGAKLRLIENMNHILKESDSNPQKNKETYKNPQLPLAPGLVDEIVNFIRTVNK